MQKKSSWVQAIFFVVLLFMLVSILSYAYLGTFTRYMADDYCTAAVVKDLGFWKAQSYWWQNWSGRYSFTFIISLVDILGLWVVPILPAFIILQWLYTMVWAGLPYLKRFKFTNSVAAGLFVACLALWLTYRNVEDYPQIVFWQTGILTYPVSPILFLFGIGTLARRVHHLASINALELFGWFSFAMVAGGFSETNATIQIALIALILIYVIVTKIEHRKLLFSIAGVTLLGSVLSLFIMAIAPGNMVRSEDFSHVPPLHVSIVSLVKHVLLFIPDLIEKGTIGIALAFLGGIFLVYCCLPDHRDFSNLSILRGLVASTIVALVGIFGALLPSLILTGQMPRERVLLFPYFLVVCTVIFWGALCAIFLKLNLPPRTHLLQTLISLVLLPILIFWGVLPVLVSRIQLIPALQQYSMIWDTRHEHLLSASQHGTSVMITDDFMKMEALRDLRTRLWVTGDFETSPDYWVNICAAQYYGVEQVTAK